jgi:site-specific DNA-methyltransferase (adenine-specific)
MKLINYHDGGFYNADCLDAMSRLPTGCVDMILCDLPYGTTQNKWDSVIPFDELWKQYWRVLKRNGAVVLTAAQPFTSALIMSDIKHFKQELVWCKNVASDFMNANRRHMAKHENVLLFYRETPTYNPQLIQAKPYRAKRYGNDDTGDNYGKINKRTDTVNDGFRHPTTVLNFNREVGLHPTQKPVALFEYLIKTYTNPGEIVLDNTAGSGTTAVAARNTGRRWICMERDETYFERAIERVSLTHRSAAA